MGNFSPLYQPFKLIKSDIYRYTGNLDFFKVLKAILTIEGIRFSIIFRLGSSLSKKNPLFYLFYFFNRFLGRWYGFQIPLKTKIGYGLYLGHTGTIILNGDCIIGNNCNLSPGVTLGRIPKGDKEGCPILEDNVWVGTNSVIVGKIKIGTNSHVAPNSLSISNKIIEDDWTNEKSYVINKWIICSK